MSIYLCIPIYLFYFNVCTVGLTRTISVYLPIHVKLSICVYLSTLYRCNAMHVGGMIHAATGL